MFSKKAADLIIQFEIGGRSVYDKSYQKPTWPGGESGITIGIGVDLGYTTDKEFMAVWSPSLNLNFINALRPTIGLKGQKAKSMLKGEILNVRVPYNVAYEIFIKHTLPKFYKATLTIYPEMIHLNEDTQGALVSMVFNRGTNLAGDRRKEMKAIIDLVKLKDYEGIAEEIEKSKRLWEGAGLDGLVVRREAEADLIRNSIA
jgi:hypothetical protein